jgi:hypothetical protein
VPITICIQIHIYFYHPTNEYQVLLVQLATSHQIISGRQIPNQTTNVSFPVKIKVTVGQTSASAVQLAASKIWRGINPKVISLIGTGERFQPSAMGRRSSRKNMLTNLSNRYRKFAASELSSNKITFKLEHTLSELCQL